MSIWYNFLVFRFDKSEGIVVIGATNFPEILDKYVASCFLYLCNLITLSKLRKLLLKNAVP